MRSQNWIMIVASALLVQCDVSHAEDVDYGTFQDPSARVRPRFRYWIPDASVDLKQVRSDIADAGKVGVGGLELLGYFNYGDIEGGPGIIGTDWAKYGWGTPAWRQVQDTAISAVKDNNMIIDLTLGPNQGAGVPSSFAADGLQWDLQPFNVSIPVGGNFHGQLPGWGIGSLVSASTGLVINNTVNQVLSAASLKDVSGQVDATGHINITFPSDGKGVNNVLFAYYLVHSDYREQQTPDLVISGKGVHQSTVTSYVQNGSWVVDHFSEKGAQAVADFWNQNLLNGGDTADLLRTVGNYVWEDSQEYSANVMWTPNMTNAFQINRGYSINKYIPILLHGNRGVTFFGPSQNQIYITDESDAGAHHVEDYRQTLTELNALYLRGLTKFANSIGVKSSAQVVYNFPMDMLANVPDVDAPECESLAFLGNIDTYRQYAGPAVLADASAYQQFIPTLLGEIKRSIAGGVNNFILHGMPYSGSYVNTTWPSYTTFAYTFSEMHNRHQPGWEFYDDWVKYTGRLQYVMQSGVPKVDVAFWLKDTTYTTLKTSYTGTDLDKAGYTIEYLSPDDFSLPAAIVQDGILAPAAQAFKGLVVRQNDNLTVSGVQKLGEWAKQGLPILFAGGLPSTVSGTVTPAQIDQINSIMVEISSLSNVHTVPSDNIAQSLASIGIHPRTSTSIDGPSTPVFYTRWHESNETVVFVYNSGAPGQLSNGTLTFESTDTPYIYDAWTGTQMPVMQYSQTNTTTTLSLSLVGGDAAIVAFRRLGVPPPYANQASGPFKTQVQALGPAEQHFVLVSQQGNPVDVRLSNEKRLSLPANNISAIPLTNWDLTIESWSAPSAANFYNVDATVKRNTTYKIKALQSWDKLKVSDDLTHVSGRGYYATSFSWPPTGLSITNATTSGAILMMTSIVHTAVVYVNGQKMPPINLLAPQLDISHALRAGQNKVLIVVSTPLGNALIPVMSQLRTAGAGVPNGSFLREASYGLTGTVTVQPYEGITVV